jgi:hypothetical protein
MSATNKPRRKRPSPIVQSATSPPRPPQPQPQPQPQNDNMNLDDDDYVRPSDPVIRQRLIGGEEMMGMDMGMDRVDPTLDPQLQAVLRQSMFETVHRDLDVERAIAQSKAEQEQAELAQQLEIIAQFEAEEARQAALKQAAQNQAAQQQQIAERRAKFSLILTKIKNICNLDKNDKKINNVYNILSAVIDNYCNSGKYNKQSIEYAQRAEITSVIRTIRFTPDELKILAELLNHSSSPIPPPSP